MPNSYARPPDSSFNDPMAMQGDTHLTKYLADLWAGDKVTASTDHRVCRIHIVALCWVRETELHIRCEGYGPIRLYQNQ
jgi:hypothetical protein